MIEIKFYKSSWQAIKLMLLALPFVIFSLYDIIGHSQTMPPALSWVCLCFFGLAIPFGLYNLLDRRPEMVINEEGIFDRQAAKDIVRWEFIESAYVKEMRVSLLSRQKFLCIEFPKDTEPPVQRRRLFSKANKSMGYGDISIGLSPLKKYDWQKLADLINAIVHTDASVRQNLLLNYKS